MIAKGIHFGEIHSYDDLDLILSTVNIPPAVPKTNFIDLPGGDGSLDLTEALGDVKYNDRDCTFTFTMNPAGDLSDSSFEAKKTEVSNALNGLACRITLDKDAEFYYEGRCTVNEYLSNKRLRQIIVAARVKPYKMKQDETVVEKALTSSAAEVVLTNGKKKVIPSILCSHDNATVIFEGNTFKFNAGTHQNLNIQLKEGKNILKVSGTGTIRFTYQEGEL